MTSASLYVALLAGAALVNAAGYVLGLWHEETAFDEAVHLYTSFAVVAAIGRFAPGRWAFWGSPPRWWTLIVLGAALGLAWEAFEWVIGIVGSRRDTLIDLLMDVAGAAAAAVLLTIMADEAQTSPRGSSGNGH